MPKLILKDFELTEISGVDRPAQPTATMAIMKRAVDNANDRIILKGQIVDKIEKAGTSFLGQLKAENFRDKSWNLIEALRKTMEDAVASNDSEAMRRGVDEFTTVMLENFSSDMTLLTKKLASFKGDKDSVTSKEGTEDMPTIEELSKKVDDLTDKLAKADALAKLTDVEKAYLEKRTDEDKEKFMGMSKEEREKEMNKAATELAKNDETIEVDGSTVRKSEVGASMFAVIKSQQAQLKTQQEMVAKAQAEAEMATLTKRASDDFGHVVGKAEDIAGVLKAMEAMPTSAKEALENILKSAEEMSAAAFKKNGRTDATDVTKSVTEKLDDLAKNYAKDNSVSYEMAYEHVAMENPELYKQLVNQ